MRTSVHFMRSHKRYRLCVRTNVTMIEAMSTVHMNEKEVTANFADVLEKVRHGIEVIVERNHQPVAVI